MNFRKKSKIKKFFNYFRNLVHPGHSKENQRVKEKIKNIEQ